MDSPRRSRGGAGSLVLLPAGAFTIDSPAGEAERGDDEVAHRRVIRQPF